ncbi:MAG: LysM peptidoglycan-binding domain-containing protein [Bacteroidales bacterium]|nr:LysM peptidoglycan-binding domain-containing protein [Bacteroidales bacterium]
MCCVCGLLCGRLYAQAPDTVVENGSKYVLHDVVKGETLYGLSKKYGLTVERLVEANPGTENGIQIGQRLKIYAGEAVETVTHKVQKGESLYAIAKKYGVKVQDLLDWNPGLTEHLSIGQPIRVRKSAVTVANKRPEKADAQLQAVAKPVETPARQVESNPPEERPQPVPVAQVSEEKVYADAEKGKRKSEYNVFLLLPLYTQQPTDEGSVGKIEDLDAYEHIKSFDFIQFYEAALLAVEDISSPEVQVNFYIKDVNEKNNAELGRWIAEGVFANADLVIGPFFRENFRTMLSYAQNHAITIVNPFTVAEVETSAQLFRTMATYTAQAAQLAEYIRSRYTKAQVLLLNNMGSDSKRVSAYRSSLMKALQDYPGIAVKEVNYKNGGVSAVNASLNPTCENFVLAFFDGEITVTNFIQTMNRNAPENVTLVTSADWQKYDKIETEYFARLKTHYIDQFFVDYSDPEVIRFIDRFRERYTIEPTLGHFAFQGYDITRFFLSGIMRYGSGFGLQVNELQEPSLCTRFHYAKGPGHTYENQFCHIYRLLDYRLVNAWLAEEETTPVITPGKAKKNK